MTEIDHLIETANHGLKAIEILVEKYGDQVEWRMNGGEWQKITAEVVAMEYIEFRVQQPR